MPCSGTGVVHPFYWAPPWQGAGPTCAESLSVAFLTGHQEVAGPAISGEHPLYCRATLHVQLDYEKRWNASARTYGGWFPGPTVLREPLHRPWTGYHNPDSQCFPCKVRACVCNDFSQHSSQQSEMSHRSFRGHLGSGHLYQFVMVDTLMWMKDQEQQSARRRYAHNLRVSVPDHEKNTFECACVAFQGAGCNSDIMQPYCICKVFLGLAWTHCTSVLFTTSLDISATLASANLVFEVVLVG